MNEDFKIKVDEYANRFVREGVLADNKIKAAYNENCKKTIKNIEESLSEITEILSQIRYSIAKLLESKYTKSKAYEYCTALEDNLLSCEILLCTDFFHEHIFNFGDIDRIPEDIKGSFKLKFFYRNDEYSVSEKGIINVCSMCLEGLNRFFNCLESFKKAYYSFSSEFFGD